MDDGLQEEVYEADGEGEKGESTEETKAIFDDFTFVANEEAKMCGEDVEERARNMSREEMIESLEKAYEEFERFHDSVNSPINNINLQQNWDSESGEKLQVPEHQTVKKEIERKGRKMGKGSRRQAQRSTSSDEKN
uniref:Uncharacterized protein n=1 Tax=Amorphochlora amoebiformis TaxID=1561963 RepID=A0A7S0GQ01_9EUKA|mmetsp:Transcript_13268/g.21017  ORF Transcript_13268/g.21017 Transcript_13268/m.21017 type:complete len:136 (+) Transcript_13268:78-485(+)